MRQRARSWIKYFVSALLTVLFLYLAFRGTDFSVILQSLANAKYSWIVLYTAILLVSHVFRALRWRYLLDPIKEGIGMRNLFSAVMIGYFINNVLPRAGELVRPYSLAKLESVSRSSALATIVAERILDAMAFLFLIAILPLVYTGPLRQSFPWLEDAGLILLVLVGGAVGLMVVVVYRRPVLDRILRVVTAVLPDRFGKRVSQIAHRFVDGFLFLKHPRGFLPLLVLSFLTWFCYALMTYAGFYAFGLQETMGFGAAITVLAISSIGVAVPTPGSTGSYHFFTSQTMIRLFAVPEAVALSYATVTHAAGYILSTVVGAYFLLRDHISISRAVSESEGS
jgi:glycosyltransferase 2 family protein